MSLLLCAQRLAPWSPSSAAALPLTQRAAACQHHSWRDGTDLLGPPLCPCKTNLQTHREQLALQVFELAVSTVTAEVPLGVELEEAVGAVALVAARQADAGGLGAGRRAGAAGVQRLALHRALRGHSAVMGGRHRDGGVRREGGPAPGPARTWE